MEENLADFGLAGKRIVYELISQEKLEESSDIVSIPFLDMALVFRYIIGTFENEITSFVIRESHLKKWDIGTVELMKAASENTPRIMPAKIQNMKEAISNLSGMELEEVQSIYVLTNTFFCRGAAAILYPDVLKNFADLMDSDLCILPSSVHEVILVPHFKGTTYEQFRDMICSVNEAEVLPEEVLSTHPYYYFRECGKVQMTDEMSSSGSSKKEAERKSCLAGS